MTTILNEEQKIKLYGEQILEWYGQIKRDLPWRKNHDPYRIWVSEIMLQQTRVDTVIPYYNTFMDKFASVQALANAPEEEVVKAWEGLGYYSRARNLQAGAKMVMEQYGGIIPDQVEEVAKLKGVGPYTCGAIMSIAYNAPVPAVDGNVMRVLSRYFLLEDDIAKPATRVKIEKLVARMIPDGQARYFNQALMELGALICTPKSPGCLVCPVMEHCEARMEGRAHELPIKTKAKKARVEHRIAAIIIGTGQFEGKLLVRQRPNEGLLAGMWELPHILVEEDVSLFEHAVKEQPKLGAALSEQLLKQDQILVKPESWYSDEEHIFSHIRWKMRFYNASLNEEQLELIGYATQAEKHALHAITQAAEAQELYASNSSSEEPAVEKQSVIAERLKQYRFISKEDMQQLPFPNLFLRVIERYWEQ